MREIKFRGIRVDNEEWVIGYYVKDPQGRSRIYLQPFSDASFNTYYFVNPETVSQYTGLTDKNGVEIYKGDLLNIGTDDFGFIVNNNGVTVSYEVKIDGCDYILYRADTNLNWGRLSRLSDMGWECKVVGSIHEKIEL